jgi:hypothetical protein
VIRPLRVVHRAVWPALAAVLAVLVPASLVVRRPVPVVPDARPFAQAHRRVGEVEGQRVDGGSFRAALLGADDRSGPDLWLLVPADALRGRPDLLAYFIADGHRLRVEEGTLLGTIRAGAALPLSGRSAGARGVLALYDLAHGEIVATLRLSDRNAP